MSTFCIRNTFFSINSVCSKNPRNDFFFHSTKKNAIIYLFVRNTTLKVWLFLCLWTGMFWLSCHNLFVFKTMLEIDFQFVLLQYGYTANILTVLSTAFGSVTFPTVAVIWLHILQPNIAISLKLYSSKSVTVMCKTNGCTKYSFWQCYVSHCNLAVNICSELQEDLWWCF